MYREGAHALQKQTFIKHRITDHQRLLNKSVTTIRFILEKINLARWWRRKEKEQDWSLGVWTGNDYNKQEVKTGDVTGRSRWERPGRYFKRGTEVGLTVWITRKESQMNHRLSSRCWVGDGNLPLTKERNLWKERLWVENKLSLRHAEFKKWVVH